MFTQFKPVNVDRESERATFEWMYNVHKYVECFVSLHYLNSRIPLPFEPPFNPATPHIKTTLPSVPEGLRDFVIIGIWNIKLLAHSIWRFIVIEPLSHGYVFELDNRPKILQVLDFYSHLKVIIINKPH